MRSPRIALKEKAARGLKAWAALEGREPNAILEELVMAALPAKVKEMLGEEPGSPRTTGAKEPHKGAREPGSHIAPEEEDLAGEDARMSTTPKPELTNEARSALAYILEELEAGREPTSREAADKVGLTPTGLGMALSKHGIKAQNTRREMKSVKIYTKPMIGRIREILRQA